MYPRSYGEYVLLEQIGIGGMSEVDLARKGADLDFVRFLVIKRIKANRLDDDAFVRMFKDEARITSELHHANIAQVYDFGRVSDEYYLALEYVPGLDVRRVINSLREKRQRVPLKVSFRILIDVLDGLQYAHTKVDTLGSPMDIVHRDVNPRNIMVSVRGDVKLIDFGVARATNRLERTKTDHVKGKFAYMAPEQIDGSSSIDHRVDVFAVGLTLHELLTGYGPFYGLSQMQIMHRLLAGKVPTPDVPPEFPDADLLTAIHDKAVALDPADRYADAKEFARALESAAAHIGGAATRQEMVAFLGRVKPTLQKEVRDKLHSYSGPVDMSVLRASAVADSEASMSGVNRVESQTALSIGPRGMVAGSLLTMGFVSVLVLLVVILAVVLAQSSGGDQVSGPIEIGTPTAPVVPVNAPPEPSIEVAGEPDAVIPSEQEPVATPGPVPAEAEAVATPVQPAPTEPAVAQPSPAPVEPVPVGSATPAPPEPVAVEPAPVQPAPVEPAVVPAPVEPAVEPAPVAEAEPVTAEPAVYGQMMVNAGQSGLAIHIGGKPTGHNTPAKFNWPIGRHVVTVEGYAAQTVEVRKGRSVTLLFRE